MVLDLAPTERRSVLGGTAMGLRAAFHCVVPFPPSPEGLIVLQISMSVACVATTSSLSVY